MAHHIRIDPEHVNILGQPNQDSTIVSEFTFHHGHVVKVMNTLEDIKKFGYQFDKIPSDASQLIAISPTFEGTLTTGYLKTFILAQPLLRGISDSMATGDSVIYTDIGDIWFYLGPLNTTNNPNYVPDVFYNPKLNTKVNEKIALDSRKEDENGSNVNYFKKGLSKAFKPKNYKLDAPYETRTGDIDSDAELESRYSDLQLEGRHGNSIQIGSRFINPYITIRNNDGLDNNGSFIGMLSFGSIRDYVNDFDGLSSDKVVAKAKQDTESYPGSNVGVGNDSTDVEDIPRQDIFNLNYGGVKPTPKQQTEFDQLIMFSDRITFDAKDNDLTMSAKRNINVGAGQNISITSKGFSLIESNNIYLGVQSQAKTEPMVLGEELRKMLEDITKILKNAHALVQGVPIPLVDKTGAFLYESKSPALESPILNLTEIVKQLEARTETDNNGVVNYGKDGPNFLSHHHYIETNRQEPTQE